MQQKIKKTIRTLRNKRHFIWNNILTKIAYGLGRFSYPSSKKIGTRKISTIGIVRIDNGKNQLGINLPPNYKDLIEKISSEAGRRMLLTENCQLRSADEELSKKLSDVKKMPVKVEDIAEIKQGLVGHIRLKKTLDLPGLQELVSFIIPQIEQSIYHSPVIVEKAIVYRNLASKLPEYSSVLWHSDNHFEGVIKIMIYLSDVTETQAPFEYLRHKLTGEAIHIKPQMPQFYPNGRVPASVIEKYKDEGYEAVKIVGKKGTMFVFDDKTIHKGNYAQNGHRDAMVLQLKPAIKAPSVYINSRWTSSS